MKYPFPYIENIKEVLPHIEGRPEFIVAERDDYTVINYMMMTDKTFAIENSEDIGGMIRRECRGIIFNNHGILISRPFHKFFNVGEREETFCNNIDLSIPHIVLEKVDGSMIRPVRMANGKIRLGTKMGVTEVSMQAEVWLASKPQYYMDWLDNKVSMNYTPIFEWISPENKIVVNYDEANLVLLAIRDNYTGAYLPIDQFDSPFDTVNSKGMISGNVEDHIANTRMEEGREGDVICFENGHRVKIKNEWYVRVHRAKDKINQEWKIVDLIMNHQLDDLYPVLDAEDFNRVKAFEKKFSDAYIETIGYLKEAYNTAMFDYNSDRKSVALELVPTLRKGAGQFVFRQIDGYDLVELLDTYIMKKLKNTKSYDEMKELMLL